jgi:hypothetical protein
MEIVPIRSGESRIRDTSARTMSARGCLSNPFARHGAKADNGDEVARLDAIVHFRLFEARQPIEYLEGFAKMEGSANEDTSI